ncbi:MAG TPA: alkaline phosphatase family protein, partial [Polyangiaceae bacterium]|nr:alkaline phosphatase family protein [Polyangiaceae bacterium]
MKPLLVVDVVGLSQELIGPDTPHIARLVERGVARPLEPIVPAVTCSVQATFLTGRMPKEHGIVGNGWYFRELAEVWLWRQSNHLIESPQIWQLGRERDPAFTSANLFWWYNMYSAADWSVTPRPMYPADGRKLPDVYSAPGNLRHELQEELGQFPLFNFWGPAADIRSSRWIARATLRVLKKYSPTLTLAYLPHLDYDLQRFGPDREHPRVRQALRDVDALCGELIDFAASSQRRIILLSEYGISRVSHAVHINRELRRAGWLAVREELGRELLDAGASQAFAVADHQVAHVYVKQPGLIPEVAARLRALDGVEQVLDRAGQAELGLSHARAGELVAISRADRWFSYYYWLEPSSAPDFASCVEIHRKPGYDPVELFLDPKLPLPKASIAWRLLKKTLGFRTLMDVISPDDDSLVRGSHGRLTGDERAGPVFISSEPGLSGSGSLHASDVLGLMLAH